MPIEGVVVEWAVAIDVVGVDAVADVDADPNVNSDAIEIVGVGVAVS